MTRKLSINPDVCYMLGIYSCNSSMEHISVSTASDKIIERLVKIALFHLDLKMENINIVKDDKSFQATIRNSKIKKLFDSTMKRRDKIFKYKNEYSGSYFAGMFDCAGATDNKGLFIKNASNYDAVLLERIGFHTATKSARTYIKNDMDFIMFIAPYSIKAQTIHWPAKKH